MHIQHAELATTAFLERNPKGYDNPDLLKLTFFKPTLVKARTAKDLPPESRDAQICGLGVADGGKRNALVKGHQPAMMPGCQGQQIKVGELA